MFTNEDVIYAYTRQDAINDGTFIDVSETAKEAGVKIPVAVTGSLYHKHINPDPMPAGQDKDGRLLDLMNMLVFHAKGSRDSFLKFNVKFGRSVVEVWAVVEPQSPADPSPAINIMLPSDY